MSFIDMSSELVGRLPGLSPFLADTFINRAWRDIRDARLWSFLQEDCGIVCPVQTVAGTVNIVQFQNTVTADAAASAALLAIQLPPPLDLTAMQIRFGGSNNAGFVGQIYQITAFDPTVPTAVVLTLDRPVFQATNPTSGYQCYRCYIKPTIDDFLKWTNMVDMTNGWDLIGKRRVGFTSSDLDARDPQRMAQGLAYYVASFKGNPGETSPRPTYELWPHPVQGQIFYGRFRRAGTNFLNQIDEQSQIIPESLIIERTLGWYGYVWASENVGRIPQLKGPNYAQLMLASRQTYKEELVKAKKQDDEQELQTVWNRGHGLIHGGYAGFKGMVNFPIDANFIQSHLVNL